MKIKKPSLKGIKNTGYLGHFAQDKFIQQGHNDSGRFSLTSPMAGMEEYKNLKSKLRKGIRESLDRGQMPQPGFDKPVSKMTPAEKNRNAFEYKVFMETLEEEQDMFKKNIRK